MSSTCLNFKRLGKGRTLVLLHGFLGGAGVWVPLESGLKRTFDLIVVDLPGFAGSAAIPVLNTVEGFAATIINLLDTLGVERFSLLGWSLGGMIAQQIALDHGTRVECLVLYATSAVGELPHRFESWEQSLQKIESAGVAAVTDKTAASWFVDGVEDPFYSICRNACTGASKVGCAQAIRAMRQWRVTDRLREIKIPTLIIVGDKDRSATPDDSMILWKGIQGSSLCVMPSCAHGAHMERTDLFNRIVGEFLVEQMSSVIG